MLAVSEQTASTLKRDGASYAKLSLLTQQMHLLQAQAQNTVSKSVAKAEATDGDLSLSESCTTLSTEFDAGAKRLLAVMAVNEKTVAMIKRDPPAAAKLSLLSEQVGMLQDQAHQAIGEAEVNSHLFEVAARWTCRLVPGTMYYHYTQHGNEVLSRIADDDWDNYDEYHGKYLYDWDHTFRRQPTGSAETEQYAMSTAPAMLMLPNITATPPTPSVASKAVEPAPEPMDMDASEPSFGAAAELMRTSGSVSGKVLSRW